MLKPWQIEFAFHTACRRRRAKKKHSAVFYETRCVQTFRDILKSLREPNLSSGRRFENAPNIYFIELIQLQWGNKPTNQFPVWSPSAVWR